MRRRTLLFVTALAVVAALGRPGDAAAEDPAAIAARMTTHQETAGLREISKPIVTATGATCTAGGSLGHIQALFFDLAGSEPTLAVTSIEIRRAGDAMLAKGVLVTVEYTVASVAAPDERTEKARWAVPVLLNALLGGTVASQNLTLMSAKIADGTLTVDARSSSGDASKAVVKQLDPGEGHLVTAADVDQRKTNEIVQDPAHKMPQHAVTSYAFKLTAHYDAAPIRLDVLKRMAYN